MPERREGGFLISKIKQLGDRIFDKKLKKNSISDINSAQGRIIFSLWKTDNVSIKNLVKETALSKTTLTSMLNRLNKSGLISKAYSEDDKRITIVSLTKKSKDLRSNYDRVSTEMNNLFYKGLTEVQIEQFELTLNHILNNLKKKEEESK